MREEIMNFRKFILPTLSLFLLFTTFPSLLAAGDLIIELGEPQLQPRDGYSEDVFVPFKIKNIGDEPITSRFPVKMINPASRSGIGYPLYVYSDEVKREGIPAALGVPVIKGDGTTEFRKLSEIAIPVSDGVIMASGITIFPSEAINFADDFVKPLATFSYSESGTYTIGYEIDPQNEIPEEVETNNLATTELILEVDPYVKGPNELLGLAENQYWFYYPNKEGCHTLDTPLPTEICLVDYGSFTAKLTIAGEEVTLWHFFKIWGWTKEFKNLEIVSADGFLLTVY